MTTTIDPDEVSITLYPQSSQGGASSATGKTSGGATQFSALKVTASDVKGWTEVTINLSAEEVPNSFTLVSTEPFKNSDSTKFLAQPGDKIELYIGEDLALRGYVDVFQPSISASDHSISISGRGLCEDLVDASAEWQGSQLSGFNTLEVAKKLAQPYGITVSSDLTDLGKEIPQFNIMYGETPYDIIERCCRYAQFILYEKPDGSLLITQIGNVSSATVLQEGVNVQEATILFSSMDRYSTYNGYLMATNIMGDSGDVSMVESTQTDPNFPRHRMKAIVAETVGGVAALDLLKARLVWEVNRRNGRSRRATIVTDSWRDQAGKLWIPNTLIDVQIPTLKLDTIAENAGKWVIGSVSYRKSEAGTTATIVAMPKLAFSPEPTQLIPLYPDASALPPSQQVPPP